MCITKTFMAVSHAKSLEGQSLAYGKRDDVTFGRSFMAENFLLSCMRTFFLCRQWYDGKQL